ncbi:MAG: endonuclease, partial [Candidatus Cryptobacteroides sp.]
RRGIDVALIYRRDSLELVESGSVTVTDGRGQPLQTRNMLVATFRDHRGMLLHVIVNHHPSKFGGAKASENRRNAVMSRMAHICDSLVQTHTGPVLSMGDFNDFPDAHQFSVLDGVMENLAIPLHTQGSGTIKYRGRWELIDHFLLSSDYAGKNSMKILEPPFLLVRDNAHTGYKPFRTYSGPRYIGGVSDHLPILMNLSR